MSLEKFVYDLNEVYQNISIYRAIIIAKDINEAIELNNKLIKYDFIVKIINNIDNLDLNCRLFIILLDDIELIKKINKNYYNFLSLTYSINKNIINLIE